eukprot:CAMPEP_0114552588 /NCGR_PEP_ID=MMETSP0114-20121206/7201_1 /TAXON_ID=31324 /ORGANISM="Goniomonas sp, Strain m" /LENGTH=568 /DNA_ID=CAMNT_0001737467 /DNA_START=169 /DNA_END=1875 /DNA_ORIENTATION=-
MSGLEVIEKKVYEDREKTRLSRLKNMRSTVDNKAPPKFKHILTNRKKQMRNVDRYSEIERENYRLLARMGAIMTHQHMQDYVPPLCPALDKIRSRNRMFRAQAGENAILSQRLAKMRSHYDTAAWKQDMVRHDHALTYLCKYPRVLEPLSDAGVWMSAPEPVEKPHHAPPHTPSKLPTTPPCHRCFERANSAMEFLSPTASSAEGFNGAMDYQKRPETSIGMTRDVVATSPLSTRSYRSEAEQPWTRDTDAPRPHGLPAPDFDRETSGRITPISSSHSGSTSPSNSNKNYYDGQDDGFTVPNRVSLGSAAGKARNPRTPELRPLRGTRSTTGTPNSRTSPARESRSLPSTRTKGTPERSKQRYKGPSQGTPTKQRRSASSAETSGSDSPVPQKAPLPRKEGSGSASEKLSSSGGPQSLRVQLAGKVDSADEAIGTPRHGEGEATPTSTPNATRTPSGSPSLRMQIAGKVASVEESLGTPRRQSEAGAQGEPQQGQTGDEPRPAMLATQRQNSSVADEIGDDDDDKSDGSGRSRQGATKAEIVEDPPPGAPPTVEKPSEVDEVPDEVAT